MIAKLLIANRGESACRVARTCRDLGIAAATVHSSIDRRAFHVRAIGESIEIGGASLAESYLDGEAVIAAAGVVGADAIHPGIGFLAEDPAFARAVEAAGLIFVGPRPETLERFADKAAAKGEARSAGIPVIEGSDGGSAQPDEVIEMARALAPPLLLKATAGGGGRGVRMVRSLDGLAQAVASAMNEAEAAFGRPDLLVERYLEGARHVEVQIAGDGEGVVIHLFERECSLQRRYQKVVEEAPAPGLAAATREAILMAACEIAARANFRGLGTVEFLVIGDEHRFLEVNPRLQVEHPVTEMIVDLDLVELQLAIAAGRGLGLAQADIVPRGHAIEARLYAEDPSDGFLPSAGVVRRIEFPRTGLRVERGVAAGDAVPPYYDPMIAKLIAHGGDRAEALAALRAGLAGVSVLGVETNLSFLRTLLAHPRVIEGDLDTGLIDRELAALTAPGAGAGDAAFALAAYLVLLQYRQGPASDPWTALTRFTGWRHGAGESAPTRKPSLEVSIGGEAREVAFSAIDGEGYFTVRMGETSERLRVDPAGDDQYHVSLGKRVLTMAALADGEAVYLDGPTGALTARVSLYAAGAGAATTAVEGRVLAPVMGQVTKVHIEVGDRVKAGDVLMVQESMKMELRLTAPCDGVVAELGCVEGEMIARHSVVAEIRPHQAAPAPSLEGSSP